MRKLLGLALFVCLFSGLAAALPKVDVFGGYQYSHFEPNLNMSGWNASATLGGSWLGVTGDFSGAYRSGVKLHTYAFGPELHVNLPGAKPFVHALVGGARSSSGGISDSGFVGMVGGGMDVGAGPIAFRLIQVDWMDFRFAGTTISKNVRASSGIVIRF